MSSTFSDASTKQTFQLKGTMLAITVFELVHFNIERLTKELSEKVQEAPEFFGTIPMVLSIDKLELPLSRVELKGVITLFKEFNIQLMALRTNDQKIIASAKKWGISILPPTGSREKLIELANNRPMIEEKAAAPEEQNKEKADAAITKTDDKSLAQQALTHDKTTANHEQLVIEEATPTADTNVTTNDTNIEAKNITNDSPVSSKPKETIKLKHETKPTLLISTPVRSGQQINALDCDLIVTSTISTGAELMSDGNIHIYGTMRGRAMAGFRGNNKARIFCTKLTAEFMSIAGQMITEEELRHNPLWGKPAQLYLEENQLIITPLA